MTKSTTVIGKTDLKKPESLLSPPENAKSIAVTTADRVIFC